jgi:hypothetical protein
MLKPQKTKPDREGALQLRRHLIQCLQHNSWHVSMIDLIAYIEQHDAMQRRAWSQSTYTAVRTHLGDIIRSTKTPIKLIFQDYTLKTGKDGKESKRVILHDPVEDEYFHIQGLQLRDAQQLELHFQHILRHNLEPRQQGLSESIEWVQTYSNYVADGLVVNAPEVEQPALFAA